jgi:hypothetical protein
LIDERSRNILVKLHVDGGKWIEKWVQSTSAFAKLDPTKLGDRQQISSIDNPVELKLSCAADKDLHEKGNSANKNNETLSLE